MLSERPAYGINGNFSSPEKKFSTNFDKARNNFCLRLHHNHDNSYLFLNGKEIFKFKINNENVNFLTKFFLRSVSNGFRATDSREVSLKGNASDFSVDYNAIDNSGILNIHKYFKGE